jgi:hypothetical protein
VVSTADTTKRGLVQIRIPQIHGEPSSESEFISDDALPWAIPTFPTHDLNSAFAVGDGIWAAFWGGSSSNPVILGQFLGSQDVPDVFKSSYTPDPKTRYVSTNNGHEFEMRWVPGEEKIRITSAAGGEMALYDAPAEQGPRAIATTPFGRVVEVSDFGGGTARVQTPTQSVIIDDAGQTVTVTTPGTVSINGNTISETGVISNKTFSGAALWSALSLLLTAGAALTLTAVGLLSITGAGLVLATTAGQVILGTVAGAKKRLLHEDFITAVYNGHTHGGVTAGGGSTSGPSIAGDPNVHATQNVVGD